MDASTSDSSMEAPICPQCQTPLPAQALAGLCPACMFEQGAFHSEFNTTGTAFVPPTIEELAPLFPALEILELIGRGGMGAVYKARQTELDRVVALKILPSAIAGDPGFSERFTREARALAKLNHPGIVALYEFGRTSGLFFFLMEFVDGVNLRQLLQGERLSDREALAIVPRICDALQYAHDSGIVHRDIKPENILLDRQGSVKIADFGVAKIVAAVCDRRASQDTGDDQRRSQTTATEACTQVGKLMGTPAYMAPEQIEHPSSVDHRADIYALGVIFYQMLTGELPDQPLAPPSSRTLIDVRLDEVVIRALQQNPTLRFQQVSELKTRVEEISNSSPVLPKTRRKLRWLRIAGVLLMLCLPLSIAIPIKTHTNLSDVESLEEISFEILGQKSRQAVAELLKQTLRPYPGVTLSSQKYNTSGRSDDNKKLWRIGVRDIDLNRARERLNQAEAAVAEALNRSNTDSLREPIRFTESSTTPAGVMSWNGDKDFVLKLKWSILAGILLSTIGLLCVSLPRPAHSPPVSKTPGKISLVVFLIGAWGVFVVTRYYGFVGNQMVLGIAILAGIPAMIFGLSGRSGGLGKTVAAASWFGILALLLRNSLPDYGGLSYSGWTEIEIPASNYATAPAVGMTPTPRNKGKEKQKAVESWLASIDTGKFAEAWRRTATLTRTLESESEWTEKLKGVRQPLGHVLSRKMTMQRSTSELEGAPKGSYLVFTFDTKFNTKSDVVEKVTLIYQDDGNWRILGYSIQ